MFENLTYFKKEEGSVRVIGIDPSTTNLGISIIDVDLTKTSPFKVINVITLLGKECIYDLPEQFDDTSGTGIVARSYGLCRGLERIVELFEPDTAICEDNFLGASALTFKQLIQVVAMIREIFIKKDIHLSYVFPNLAKEVVGANFRGTKKEDVHEGLKKYKFIDFSLQDINLLDEHSVDACVVALYRCEQIAKDYGVFYNERRK